MANKKIANPKKEVPKGILLNDQDYMTILLSNLKSLTKNMAISLKNIKQCLIILLNIKERLMN